MPVAESPRLLSELSHQDLALSERTSFPKWSTLCRLRLIGLPTLDAVFIEPRSQEFLDEAVHRFCTKTQATRILIRSDGGLETKSYYRGGNSFEVSAAIEEARHLLASNRAVILMEPTNRFTNRESANLLISSDGDLVIELLGPGFDVSDLNRGGLLPEFSFQLRGINWAEYEELRPADFRFSHGRHVDDDGVRTTQRLAILAREILPQTGQDAMGVAGEAERWLRERGYCGLWEPRVAPSFRRLIQLYDDSFAIAAAFRTRSRFVVSSSTSTLDDGRIVYWDIVDAKKKFAGANQ